MTKNIYAIVISTLSAPSNSADTINNSGKKKTNSLIKKSVDDSEIKKHNNYESGSGRGTDFF